MFSKYKQLSLAIRKTILDTIYHAKHGHIGGSFSCIDILITLYFGKYIKFNPKKPNLKNRDRFILSKGHATAGFFSLLAHLGFISFKELKTYCKNNTRLGSHPSHLIPGVEFDTGSLGHGLGISCGIAYSAKIDKKNYKTIVLISDGELYEGSTWEALLFASHYKLNNLVIIIDRNSQIVMDHTEDCIKLNPLEEKIKSFGFKTITINGHSYKELTKTFDKIKKIKFKKPLVIIAKTIKGKGVSFMESNVKWHHAIPNENEYKMASKELK